MNPEPGIALVGTLDTKGEEIAYVRDRLRALGARPVVVDSGILGEPACRADVTREEVAAAAGHDLEDIRAAGSRGAAVALMLEGVRATCLDLFGAGRVHGVLCLGGAEGALLGAAAMHALPLGVPKLIVSPSASGRRSFAPFVGETDVMVMHSVIDILGLNEIAQAIFDNAAAAVTGMARDAGTPVGGLGERCVGITMLGQTTPGVMRVREALLAAGQEPVIFHANGVGGPAMEHLIEAGALDGVIDYTLSELANSLLDGIHSTGPDRLRVAGRHGLPQVVVPGCVDFFNQGPRDSLPEQYRDRKTYFHNPVATLVRLSSDEEEQLGRMIAERLNEALGKVRVIVPTRGFSLVDAEGGDLWDPDADRAFVDALRGALRAGIALEEVDAHVDDADFAELVADRYLSLLEEPAHAG
ncbi:MAG TPA: Tm-1-like ATP-binding domain-containing protein [Solirubrobacteraceae bacterium]|nr:Tm-1-like ATP-binding domain-containing protein [Solirubrobacteraceae bacterium]